MSTYSSVVVDAIWQQLNEQDWPAHGLYVVATPIGNRADLSLRAWQTLLRADVIAAEDTRTTGPLLQAWGVRTPLIAVHRHNEAEAGSALLERLARGERVALISDAGAPAISDPGGRLVQTVRHAGYRVIPIPGPSAVTTALMASGVTSDEQPAFIFAGFSPAKKTARQKWLQHWGAQNLPVLLFESPHRLMDCSRDLLQVLGPERRLSLCRELTKRFEQVHECSLAELPDWLSADAHRQRGEFVLILHGLESADSQTLDEQTRDWMRALAGQLSVRDVVRIAMQATGLPRQPLYQYALSLKAQEQS